MMFCLGQGLRAGSRAALAASLGVAFGGMVHVTLAGLGVAAAIAAAPQMFDVIRWAGCGLPSVAGLGRISPRGRPVQEGA